MRGAAFSVFLQPRVLRTASPQGLCTCGPLPGLLSSIASGLESGRPGPGGTSEALGGHCGRTSKRGGAGGQVLSMALTKEGALSRAEGVGFWRH